MDIKQKSVDNIELTCFGNRKYLILICQIIYSICDVS